MSKHYTTTSKNKWWLAPLVVLSMGCFVTAANAADPCQPLIDSTNYQGSDTGTHYKGLIQCRSFSCGSSLVLANGQSMCDKETAALIPYWQLLQTCSRNGGTCTAEQDAATSMAVQFSALNKEALTNVDNACGLPTADCINKVVTDTQASLANNIAQVVPQTASAPAVATPCTAANLATLDPNNETSVLNNCTLDYVPLEPLPTGLAGQAGDMGSGLGGYLNYLFPVLITLGAMMGVLYFTIYGIQYMLSAVPGVKTTAREHVIAVIWGLVLLVSSVLILSVINPNLTDFSALQSSLEAIGQMGGGGTGTVQSGWGTGAPGTTWSPPATTNGLANF